MPNAQCIGAEVPGLGTWVNRTLPKMGQVSSYQGRA